VSFTHPSHGVDSIHILIHSPGGSIPDGISLYNFLRAFPLNLILYNGGNVNSSAVRAFLGAKKRRASPHATFAIHRASFTIEEGRYATDLLRLANGLMVEDERTKAIYREAGLQLTEAQWADLDNNKTLTFTAQAALTSGFIQEVAEFSPPPKTILFAL
jgi:ATP-dependent protease ClpP protease subunit